MKDGETLIESYYKYRETLRYFNSEDCNFSAFQQLKLAKSDMLKEAENYFGGKIEDCGAAETLILNEVLKLERKKRAEKTLNNYLNQSQQFQEAVSVF